MRRKKGSSGKKIEKRIFEYSESENIYGRISKDYSFRKKWAKYRRERVLTQKICKYCEKTFVGDWGAVLHHFKMPEKEKKAAEEKWKIKRQIEFGEFSEEEGKEKIREIEKELIDYYRSLKDTDLICVQCHSKEHSGHEIKKNHLQTKLFYR